MLGSEIGFEKSNLSYKISQNHVSSDYSTATSSIPTKFKTTIILLATDLALYLFQPVPSSSTRGVVVAFSLPNPVALDDGLKIAYFGNVNPLECFSITKFDAR